MLPGSIENNTLQLPVVRYGPLLSDLEHTSLFVELVTIEVGCLGHFLPSTLSNLPRATVPKQRNHGTEQNTILNEGGSLLLPYNILATPPDDQDIKRQCQYECRKCFNQYVANLIDPNSNVVTKRLWSYIKSKKLDHTGVSTLKHQGSTYTDSQEKADLLTDYFSSVFTHEDTSHIPDLSGETLSSIPQIVVHSDGVA